MSYNVAIFYNILTAGYYLFDATAQITKDIDAVTNVGRVFRGVVNSYNHTLAEEAKVLVPLMESVNIFMDVTFCKLWVSRAKELASGQAAGLTNKDRIHIGGNDYIPNVVLVASRACLLVADFLGAVYYLGTDLGILNLGQIAQDLASIPVFGVVASLTLNNVRGACAVIGFVLDVADGFRDIYQNGLTVDASLRIVGDIAKIVSVSVSIIAPTMQAYIILGYVASATAGACFIGQFLIDHYDLKI